MERKEFKITIDASPEKVWHALWDLENYPQWTAGFGEGSTYQTDWKEGGKVFFLGAENEGMVSKIEKISINEFVSFKHMGTVKDGVEDTESKEAQEWAGALENYTLTETKGKTELTVEQDITEEYVGTFIDFWDAALLKIKSIAEIKK